MNRSLVAGFAAAAAVTGGLTFAMVGPSAGTALAAPFCSPSNANTPPCAPPEGPPMQCNAQGMCSQLWCPGSGMEPIPDWDMNVCHSFYFDPNAPLTEPVMIAGQPPGPPAPPRPPCIPFINCLPGLTHPI
ncbi:hypothetical protein H7I41_19430 [Mycobacterium manitobense]|jgi:hypothetical protein|uniref:Intersectin-EH binding protein Ibp1 n=1 Tax=[Mycobacterium] manitobense TaxID=190147 RepID=A0A9X2YSX6_9MYCO|nr:hypothetical protein [[Mycobacterium] manitobense]MCV7172092.1 hypothetical protein [[Mycobacterium] manitobense]